MDRLFRAIARFVTVMTISFGVRPPVVAALELLRRPLVRIEIITRRRVPEYANFFIAGGETQPSDADSDDQSAPKESIGPSSPVAVRRTGSRTYTPVRAA